MKAFFSFSPPAHDLFCLGPFSFRGVLLASPSAVFEKKVLLISIFAEGLDDPNQVKSSHHGGAAVTRKWTLLWPLYPRALERKSSYPGGVWCYH